MIRTSVAATVAVLMASATFAQEIAFETGDASETLRGLLEDASLTLSLDPEGDLAAQDYVAAARADYQRLLTALYADGHYGGVISVKVNGREAATIAPLDAPARVNSVAITVTPGPRFSFGRTEISPLPEATALPDGFAVGEPAQAEVIRRSVSTAITAWREAGYAKARAGAQNITARHPDTALDVAVTIAPGQRLTFGPLTIEGNVDVRTERVRAIAGLPSGEVFDPAEIAAAERRLRDSGAFDSVALKEADDIGPNDTLAITALVAEAKPRRIGFGVELSSVEGLSVSSYWLHRNFFGGAERLRFDAEIKGIGGETGGIDYGLGASLAIPAVLGPDTDFLISADISRQDEPDFLLDQIAIEAALTRLIREDLEVSGGLGLLRAREETDAGVRRFTLLTAPFTATLERRDEPTDAKSGYFIGLELTPFASVVGADNGARVFTDARAYRSFGSDDFVTFAARTQIGSVFGPSITDAPADFLFFSGGGGTVRGQTFNALGIDTIENGEAVRRGGLSFAGAQLEARVAVRENIGVVGFYDFGYIGESTNPFETDAFHAGVGFGVRYNTGIGPIRLDIATPATNGDDFGERVEIYIGIGQAF